MNKEILLIVDSIANEKNLEKELIFNALEIALASITAKHYNEPVDIRVNINRKTGDYETFRRWTVMEDDAELEYPGKQIILSKAKEIDEDLEVGDIVEEPIESIKLEGRIDAQQVRQVFMREIHRAEREEQIKHYQTLTGTLMNGVAKKVTRDGVFLDMGNSLEATLLKSDMLPREAIHMGDRVRAILREVKNDRKGTMLFVSRTHPNMLVELFKLEVPEIAEEVIEIKAVARDPGLRAKMAVKTNDGRIDPIGACIGIRGSRVQVVSNELGGEKIDIILWDDDPAQLVVNAMAPAEIASIEVDEERKTMDIIVREDQLAQAIGRGGQNVKLASELSGWKLNIVSSDEAAQKSKDSTQKVVALLTNNLAVDEEVAAILANEGFSSLEDIAYAPLDELIAIEGFDEEMASALRDRARDVLLEQALTSKDTLTGGAEPAPDLLAIDGMTRHLAYALASHGVRTREDLAEQSVDDLRDIVELKESTAAKLIMAARKPWFEKS